MATRKEILKDITGFSAVEIAEVIRRGELTMYELKATGKLTPLMKRKLENLLDGVSAPQADSQPAASAVIADKPSPKESGMEKTASSDDEWMSWEDPGEEIPATSQAPTQEVKQPEEVNVTEVSSSQPAETSEKEDMAEVTAFVEEKDKIVEGKDKIYTEPPLPAEALSHKEDKHISDALKPDASAQPSDVTEEETAPADDPEPEVPVQDNQAIITYYDEVPDESKNIVNNHNVFCRAFLFSGRIGRGQYILSILLFLFMISATVAIDIHFYRNMVWNIICTVVLIVSIWFMISQIARRCHDLNIRGWIMLSLIFPAIAIFLPGNKDTNRFGTTPVI